MIINKDFSQADLFVMRRALQNQVKTDGQDSSAAMLLKDFRAGKIELIKALREVSADLGYTLMLKDAKYIADVLAGDRKPVEY